MKPIRQLLRRPAKTILGVILVTLACVLLCVSVGQYYAACQMETQIQKGYTTIALPSNKYKLTQLFDEDGKSIAIYDSNQPPEIRDFLSNITENYPTIVESVAQHGLISGYCGSISPVSYKDIVIPVEGRNGFTQVGREPYTCAILAISIDKISDVTWEGTTPEDSGVIVDIEGTVLEACALEDGYDDPTGRIIQIKLLLESEEAFDALNLKTGNRYLVYGSDYMDRDWELRKSIAAGDQAIYDSISWSNIRMLTDIERQSFNAANRLTGTVLDYVAEYEDVVNGELYHHLLNENEITYVNSCSLTVCANPSVLNGWLTQTEIAYRSPDGLKMIPQNDYNEMYWQAGIIPLDGDASGLEWENARTTVEVNNHAFPVITTDNLPSIAQFAMQDTHIASGRPFTQEEYEKGTPVCVLSESLAVSNCLEVGDSITLQYYRPDYNMLYKASVNTANPTAAYYSPVMGFSSEEISYEIVGLYRQKNEWSVDEYAFTPNTIFVPKNSVSCQTETFNSGVFCTFVLKNGMSDEMDAELTEVGYEGLFSYYDQGYTEIEGSLHDYFSIANMILLIGIISFLVFVAAFLFLFPCHQKKDTYRMWTIGASQKQIANYILTSGIGILLPGSVIGGVASIVLLQVVLNYMRTYANISAKFSLPIPFVILAAVIQAIFVSGLIYLTSGILAKSLIKGQGNRK